MKQIYKTMLAVMASVPFLASCVQDLVEKGEPENDSYGVYFGTLTAAQKSVEFDPAEKAELTFTAFRTVEDDDITVPVVVSATGAEKDASSLFTASTVKFEEGQKETTFTVSFPEAELGVTYSVSVSCKDEKYVKIYSQTPTSVSFNVTRVKWNLVKGPNGEEYGSWKDDILSSLFNLPVLFPVNDKIQIYERDDKKGFYRIPNVYNPYMVAKFFGGQYSEKEIEESCTPGLYAYIDATNPDKVWLPVQESGVVISNDGYITYATLCPENGFSGSGSYGTMTNGVIKFPQKSILVDFSVAGGWYYANTSGNLVIVMPGCKDNDYSLSIATDLSENGVTPVEIEMGADLAKTKYKFYEGKVAAADLPFEALAISRDEEAAFVEESGVVGASFEKTGVYTVIAVGVDAKGEMQAYKSAEFSYVAADDEVPVVLSCGIGSAAKYVPQGYNTDNTVEVYVYGEDLVEVKLAAVKLTDLITNQDGCIQTLLKTPSVDEETLDLINTTGYAGPVTGLLPGTEYILLAYASNGYEEDLFMSEESIYTTGDPLPIYQEFEGVDEALLPETKEGYYGTYNLYAINTDNVTGLRDYLCTVKISDGGYDQDNEIDLVKVENFWGSNATKLGIDGTTYFEYYDGVLYQLDNYYGQCANKPEWYATLQMFFAQGSNLGSYGTGIPYISYGGYVTDGYISFFSNDDTYNFNMYALYIYGDDARTQKVGYWEIYQDILLVDATKDDNGIAPAPTSKKSKTINKVDYTLLSGSAFTTKERVKREPTIKVYTPDFKVVGTPSARPAKAKVVPVEIKEKTVAEPGKIQIKNGLVAISR